jgi:hypothetical protein
VQATNASISLPLVARRPKSNLEGGKIEEKKIDEALACLDRAKPDSVPEKIHYRFLALTLATFANPTTTRQQDLAYLDEWSTQHFDQISRGVLTVSENLDVSELIFIYISLVPIRTIAAMAHSKFRTTLVVRPGAALEGSRRGQLLREHPHIF